MKKVLVSYFYAVRPALRNPFQKRIEGIDEVAAAGELARVKMRKLEDEQSDFLFEWFARGNEGRVECFSVQEILVRLPRAHTEARQFRELLDRDFVGDLEGKQEIRRDLRNQAVEVAAVRKRVVGGIDANALEDFGVLGEALLLKTSFGELSPVGIARLVVEQAAPAPGLPRGRAAKHTPLRPGGGLML